MRPLSTEKHKKAVEMLKADLGIEEIAAALGVAESSIERIRDEMLPAKPDVIDVEDETPPPLKPSQLRDRNKELEEENEGLRIRIVELLEHINDLSQEQMRAMKAMRAMQEA